MDIESLKKRIDHLEYLINEMNRPDRYIFNKSVWFKGYKLGFYGMTPISQPSSNGETSGHFPGSGTTVKHDDQWSGNVGSTRYTVQDIVKHLKNLGLIDQ